MYNNFMSVNKVQNLPQINIDLYSLYHIMSSPKLDDYQKLEFVRRNRQEIRNLMARKISNPEFFNMMQNRPLIKFRPLKNSYTKAGDKILFAKSMDILPSQVSDYVKNITFIMSDINQMSKLPIDKMDTIKTYVYRHGSNAQVATFLDYELKTSKDILKTLKTTLDYGTGGAADHYVRPIHRMTNKVLLNMFNVIDDNLKAAEASGIISAGKKETIAHEVLVRLYSIQYDQKIIKL